jgi:hypothetical protein
MFKLGTEAAKPAIKAGKIIRNHLSDAIPLEAPK